MSPQHFDHRDDAYSLSIRVLTTINHIRLVFYHNINVKKVFFFSEPEVERELKMALRDTLTCASLSVLLSTERKLANQIARLVAIVVKIEMCTFINNQQLVCCTRILNKPA